MNVAEILSIRIMLDGVQKVVADLKKVEDQTKKTADAARDLQGLGLGLAAGGIGLGAMAINSYESLERLRRSMVALTDEATGNELTEWLKDFSIKANASATALQEAARGWINATGDLSRVKDVVRAMEKMQGSTGATTAQLSAAAEAIGQIQASGTLNYGDVQRLQNSGLPLGKIAEKLGVGNMKEATGMDSTKVVNAILDVLNGLPQNEPLLTQRISNIMEAFDAALAPTGKILSDLAGPLVDLVEVVVGFVTTINEATGGSAGLAAILGLLAGGLKILLKPLKLMAPWLARIGPMVAVFAEFAGILAIGTGLMLAFFDVLERFINFLRPGTITPENSVSNPANWEKAWEKMTGGPEAIIPPPSATPSAERPQRRSSWEMVYDRRHGYSALAQ
jgi:tape measure domain-containing protein